MVVDPPMDEDGLDDGRWLVVLIRCDDDNDDNDDDDDDNDNDET